MRAHSNCLDWGRPCCTSIQHAEERHDQTVTECVHEGAPESSSNIHSPSLKALTVQNFSGRISPKHTRALTSRGLGCESSTTLFETKKPDVGAARASPRAATPLQVTPHSQGLFRLPAHSFSREYRYLKYNDFCKCFSFLF